MNVVLIGYRGTGKTVIGKKLAESLNMTLFETDKLISERAGMSITEIVDRRGWEGFRDLESEVVEEISGRDGCVIDTGGGVVLRRENVENLKRGGVIILLEASVEAIRSRIRGDTRRPSLTRDRTFVEEVGEVLSGRRKRYEDVSDYSLDTTLLTVEESVARIISFIKGLGVLEKWPGYGRENQLKRKY